MLILCAGKCNALRRPRWRVLDSIIEPIEGQFIRCQAEPSSEFRDREFDTNTEYETLGMRLKALKIDANTRLDALEVIYSIATSQKMACITSLRNLHWET